MEANDQTYFVLQAPLPENFVAPLIKSVNQLVEHKQLRPYEAGEFLEIKLDFEQRIATHEPETDMMLNRQETLFLCDMMCKLKLHFLIFIDHIFPLMETKIESDFEDYQATQDFLATINEIGEEIFLVYPELKEPFYQPERSLKKLKEEAKTLNLNKTETIAYLVLDIQSPFAAYYKALFHIVDYFIINGESNFSERVREADFFCITEINEVREKVTKEVDKLKKRRRKMPVSIRDIVVLYLLNNLFQKLYFSDAGDEMHDFLARMTDESSPFSVEEIRSLFLRVAADTSFILTQAAINEENFEKIIQPIIDFEV